jgi:hypothetical protein
MERFPPLQFETVPIWNRSFIEGQSQNVRLHRRQRPESDGAQRP